MIKALVLTILLWIAAAVTIGVFAGTFIKQYRAVNKIIESFEDR